MPGLSVADAPVLEGGLNFRDLGGVIGADGRRVRRGLLYRSGTMSGLTTADQEHLAALGIRLVIDLRSNSERAQSPFSASDGWPATYWSRDYGHSSADLRVLFEGGTPNADQGRAMMIEHYRKFPSAQADAYRELFVRAAAGDLPLVFNCAAGKDRTGTAALLLLDALGVAHDAILADYLATNAATDGIWAMLQNDRALGDGDRQPWQPVIACEAAYLDAFREAIAAEHGSLAGYRRDVLGLDAATEQALRERLLEPVDAA